MASALDKQLPVTPALELAPASAPTLERRPSATSISSATTERPSTPSSASHDSPSTSTSSIVQTSSSPSSYSTPPSSAFRPLRSLASATMTSVASPTSPTLSSVAEHTPQSSTSILDSYDRATPSPSLRGRSRPRPASIHYTPSNLPSSIGLSFPPGHGPRRTPLSAGHARRQSSISYRRSDDSGPTTPVSAGMPTPAGSGGLTGGSRIRPAMSIATGLPDVDEGSTQPTIVSAGPYSAGVNGSMTGESEGSVSSPTMGSAALFGDRGGMGAVAAGMRRTASGRSRPVSMLSVSSETSNGRLAEEEEEVQGSTPVTGIGLAGGSAAGRPGTGPTLVEQHAELLTFIAKKERKCLDLREELKRHEDDLKSLKKKWESIVARERSPAPPPTSTLPPAATDKALPSVSPSPGVAALFDSLASSSSSPTPVTPTPTSANGHAGGSGKRMFSRHSISFGSNGNPVVQGKNGFVPLSPDSAINALTPGLGFGDVNGTPTADDRQAAQTQTLAALQGITSPENVAAAKKWIMGGLGKGLGGMFGVPEGGSSPIVPSSEDAGLGTLREEEEEEDGSPKASVKDRPLPNGSGASPSPPPSATSLWKNGTGAMTSRLDSRHNSVSSAASTVLSNATRATEGTSLTSASEGSSSAEEEEKRKSTSSFRMSEDGHAGGRSGDARGHSSRSASESSILLGERERMEDGDRTPLAGTPALNGLGEDDDLGELGGVNRMDGLGLGKQGPPGAGVAVGLKHGRKRSMFEGGWGSIGKKWGEIANSDTFKNSRKATLNFVDTFEKTLTDAIAIDPKHLNAQGQSPKLDGRPGSANGIDGLSPINEGTSSPADKALPSGVGAFGWGSFLPSSPATSSSAPPSKSAPASAPVKKSTQSSLADLDWTGFLNGTSSPTPSAESSSTATASSARTTGLRAKSGTVASLFSKQGAAAASHSRSQSRTRNSSTSSSSSSTINVPLSAPATTTSSKPAPRRASTAGANLMGEDDEDADALTGLNAPLAPTPKSSTNAGAAAAAKRAKRMSMPVMMKSQQALMKPSEDDDWGW